MANFFKPAYYQAADNTNYEKCDEKNCHKGLTGLVCRAGGDYDCVGAHRNHNETAELAQVGVKTLRITPASPWENGYNQSCNGSLRDELLNGEIFYSLAEAKVLIEASQRHYSTVRPHSSLGYRPPAPEAASFTLADFRFRFAPPSGGNGNGGNNAPTINTDHSVGADQPADAARRARATS